MTDEQRIELVREYEKRYGVGSLQINPCVIPHNPVPDVKKPPNVDGLANGGFVLYQYELEKEVLTLADEIRKESIAKESRL